MSAESTLLFTSIVFLGATFSFGRYRWGRLTVVDLHVLMLGAFFGAYTLVDALVNELDWADPYLAVWSHALVLFAAALAWLLSGCLRRSIRQALEVRHLADRWLAVDKRVVVLLIGALIGFQLYGYFAFGLVSHVSSHEIEERGITLPYWFTSTLPLIGPATLALFACAAAKSFVAKGRARLLWLLAVALLLLCSAFYGRRSVFLLVFLFLLLWSFRVGRNLFSLRNAMVLTAVLALLLMFSNFYQSVRYNLLTPRGAWESSALTFSLSSRTTLENLRTRQAMWQFNYLILERQHGIGRLDLPQGAIFWQAVINSIPRLIWSSKEVQDLDEMTADIYGLPVTDYPTNSYAMAQADFGYLSIFFLPLQVIAVGITVAAILQVSNGRPVLCVVLTAIPVSYLLNVENNYVDFILIYRHILLMFVLYGAGSAVVTLVGRRRAAVTRHIAGPAHAWTYSVSRSAR